MVSPGAKTRTEPTLLTATVRVPTVLAEVDIESNLQASDHSSHSRILYVQLCISGHGTVCCC